MIDRSIETATELAPIGAGVSVVVRIGVGAGRRMYPGLVRAWRGLGPGARPGQEQDETLNYRVGSEEGPGLFGWATGNKVVQFIVRNIFI